MKAKVVSVPLSQIRTDGGTQSRAALDEDTIAEYAAAYERGDEMPPVMLFFESETRSHWLADGFHRCAGAAKAGVKRIKALVTPGSLRAAILYSVGANARHGLRRTNADKRSAVEKLLSDSEWGARTDAWIAEKTGTSDRFVADLRASHPEPFGVDERIGRDGRTYKVAKAEAGGSAGVQSGSPVERREAKRTSTPGDVGDGHIAPAAVPESPGAQPGDSSASPANVGTDDEVGEPAPPPPDPIDMRGLTASAWWLGDVDKVVSEYAGLMTHLQLALGGVKRLAGLAYHKTHAEALKTAIGNALYELERRAPESACIACRDPGGPKSDTCGVCLGCGYVVRSQVDPLVPAPRAKPTATPNPTPPPARRRGMRIVMEREDGSAVDFDDVPPPGDEDALEPVS